MQAENYLKQWIAFVIETSEEVALLKFAERYGQYDDADN